jgi:hypothetical protein
MKINKTIYTILIVLISISLYLFFIAYFKEIKTALDHITHFGLLSYTITYLLLGIPLFLGTIIINKNYRFWKFLGINKNPLRPLGLAMLFSAPMFIGGLLFFKFNLEMNIQNVIAGSLVIGFIEELYYRGFLFGQFFKNTILGFIPSVLLGAILFASGHLYQSQDFNELVGIFIVTFMGAVLFAWLYIEWNENLWVPIFLHALMNLSWHLFNMDETALGGILPNVFRGLTIAFAIVFTIVYKKRKGESLAINRLNLIKQHIQP